MGFARDAIRRCFVFFPFRLTSHHGHPVVVSPEPPPVQPVASRFFRAVGRSERPSRVWVHATRQLAAGLVVIALLGTLPTLPTWQSLATATMPIWAMGLLLSGFLLVAYAAYMALWPSSASLLVSAVVGLVFTAAYASLLVIRLLVSDTHAWARVWQLDTNAFSASQEAGWCFMMLLLIGMWSYFAGRVAILGRRWELDLR